MPPAEKAYKNLSFLNSPGARHIRILCEYEEPRARFREHGIRDTIVMFGSARVRSGEQAASDVRAARRELESEPADSTHRPYLERTLVQAERAARVAVYYDQARELSKRLAAWGTSRKGGRQFHICSGAGPGIMEAANRGAAEAGAKNVGLGISLPFEEAANAYVSPELCFEFHYFFMRKYWFTYLAKAMVVFPGGFGTMDELFEILTLRQTGKVKKRLPMVLFGREYWDRVLNLDAMVEWGVISERDLLLVHRTDSVDDAYEFLTSQLSTDDKEGA